MTSGRPPTSFSPGQARKMRPAAESGEGRKWRPQSCQQEAELAAQPAWRGKEGGTELTQPRGTTPGPSRGAPRRPLASRRPGREGRGGAEPPLRGPQDTHRGFAPSFPAASEAPTGPKAPETAPSGVKK